MSPPVLASSCGSAWDEPVQSRLREFHAKTMEAAGNIERLAQAMLSGKAPANVGLLLRAYICGVGSYADLPRYTVRQITNRVGQQNGFLPSDASFFEHMWFVKPSAAQRYCPDMLPLLFDTRPNAGLEATQVLEPCPNEAMNLRLPPPLGNLCRRPWRAPFRAYATNDAVAYVHPFQYQMLSKDRSALWISGSPRGLSRCSVPDIPVEHIDKNIIVLQDRFVFSNLAHFLYDGVTRILHYAENFGVSGKDLFVLGSIPGEYHRLICTALSEHLGIAPENLFFPARAHLLSTSGKCFWFSDQMEGHARPAQMAHPRSVSALAELCAKVPATHSPARRIYISRGDAQRRRVANETALISALAERGFTPVRLAQLTAKQQIGLFRGAEIVIAPHGMGLTHIIMGTGIGRVIELFHPDFGADDYAFIAGAAGMEYDFVIGSGAPDTPDDFTIDVRRVLDLLGPDDVPIRRPAWRKNANLIPASRTFQGFFPVGTSLTEVWPQQMVWGQEARLHRRRGNATEVGRWPHIQICQGRRYTASCWVWIPEEFEGTRVALRIGDWPEQTQQAADVDRRGSWQQIWSTSLAAAKDRTWVGLDVEGTDGTRIASSCWQFEAGTAPTAYVATG
jgi:hypothetical protein